MITDGRYDVCVVVTQILDSKPDVLDPSVAKKVDFLEGTIFKIIHVLMLDGQP